MMGLWRMKGIGHAGWLVCWLPASVLIIVALGAYLLFGRELFQRPFLIAAVVIAWLGALVGISIGNESG